jgi:hypothetical protein
MPKTRPHLLRHTFETTVLDVGVSLRDVQIAACHAVPRPPCATTGLARTSTPRRLPGRLRHDSERRTRASDVAKRGRAGVAIMVGVRIIGDSSEDEMIACFLLGELTSARFSAGIRRALAAAGRSERLVTDADLADPVDNGARRALLAVTRGYGQNRDVFEDFPGKVGWIRAVLTADELAHVRYIEYSYWNEVSGGSRLPGDAAARIRAGVQVFGVSNERFIAAARAVRRGERFTPLILAGPRPEKLVCLEGHLRLTAYALAGFPVEVECLVAIDPATRRWAR